MAHLVSEHVVEARRRLRPRRRHRRLAHRPGPALLRLARLRRLVAGALRGRARRAPTSTPTSRRPCTRSRRSSARASTPPPTAGSRGTATRARVRPSPPGCASATSGRSRSSASPPTTACGRRRSTPGARASRPRCCSTSRRAWPGPRRTRPCSRWTRPAYASSAPPPSRADTPVEWPLRHTCPSRPGTTGPLEWEGAMGQRRAALRALAACWSRGPTAPASSGASDTTPTDASNDAGAAPSTATARGTARPCAPACSSPSEATRPASPARPARMARPAAPWSSRCRAARAVGHVEVGPRRLDDDERQCLIALGDGQVGGRAHGIGELTQHRAGLRPHDRGDGRRQAAEAEREAHPAVVGARDEVVHLQRRDEAVDDGTPHPERRRELRHRQTGEIAPFSEGLEDPNASVESLRRLRPWSSGTRRHPLSPPSARRRRRPTRRARGPATTTSRSGRRRRRGPLRRARAAGRCRP